jgi:hypothetical protein
LIHSIYNQILSQDTPLLPDHFRFDKRTLRIWKSKSESLSRKETRFYIIKNKKFKKSDEKVHFEGDRTVWATVEILLIDFWSGGGHYGTVFQRTLKKRRESTRKWLFPKSLFDRSSISQSRRIASTKNGVIEQTENKSSVSYSHLSDIVLISYSISLHNQHWNETVELNNGNWERKKTNITAREKRLLCAFENEAEFDGLLQWRVFFYFTYNEKK